MLGPALGKGDSEMSDMMSSLQYASDTLGDDSFQRWAIMQVTENAGGYEEAVRYIHEQCQHFLEYSCRVDSHAPKYLVAMQELAIRIFNTRSEHSDIDSYVTLSEIQAAFYLSNEAVDRLDENSGKYASKASLSALGMLRNFSSMFLMDEMFSMSHRQTDVAINLSLTITQWKYRMLSRRSEDNG